MKHIDLIKKSKPNKLYAIRYGINGSVYFPLKPKKFNFTIIVTKDNIRGF